MSISLFGVIERKNRVSSLFVQKDYIFSYITNPCIPCPISLFYSHLAEPVPPNQIQSAQNICRTAGVSDLLMEGWIFDVGMTGSASFAEATTQAFTHGC